MCPSSPFLQILVEVSTAGQPPLTYTIMIRRLRPAGVSAGHESACFFSLGKVACWGKNEYGQLGRGNTAPLGSMPTDMSNLNPIPFNAGLLSEGVGEMDSGWQHVCMLTVVSGSIVCWGRNSNGELGAEVAIGTHLGDAGPEVASLAPVVFGGPLSTLRAVQVAAGSFITCALIANGSIICWGYGATGALGRDSNSDKGGVGVLTTLDPIVHFIYIHIYI
jgi:alpha-tubulin suppressor-like RCC1 family protein